MSATFTADVGTFWPMAPGRASVEQARLDPPSGLTIVAPDWAQTSSVTVSTVAFERDWRLRVLRTIQAKGTTTPVGSVSLAALVTWINNLPDALPVPAVAVGDDRSIHVEWAVAGITFYLAFFDDGLQEAYFEGANGDEWETSEIIGVPKIDRAIDQLLAAM